jgi:rod shape-determining protein MreB
VATAVGAGIDITRPDGHMVIDIGGGTTEVAVVSLGGVVECQSIKTAGDSFDEAIIRYVRRKYNILIGQRTAEEVKRRIGCVMPNPEVGIEEVKGRDVVTGLPKSAKLSSQELMEVFREPLVLIMEAVHNTLERTPPELVGDLGTNGIVMSGGGSLIYGIDKLVEKSTGIRTVVVDDALSCAAYGAGKMLDHLGDMQDGMLNFSRKRQMTE